MRLTAKTARSDGEFKKEREAWTTVVLALGLSRFKEGDWWIEVEITENTTDTRLHQIDQSSGHNVIQTRCVEVVDWEENVDYVLEVIRKKCGRAYPAHYILAVHARHRGELLNVPRLIEEMKGIQSPFLEVWVIAAVVDPDRLIAARVAPGGPTIEMDVAVAMEKARGQAPFVKRLIRGTAPGFKSIGATFLPIP